MFKSGFIIFLISNKELILSKDHTSLPIFYKKIFINNKINLIQNTYNIFNMNSLRFIMIKLGIIYKEFYLIEKGMENLKNFDLKTAHLLMQYIVETSDLPYIVANRNDNFYIYIIRTAINYIISLFKQRTEKLKNNSKFQKSKFLKNTKFLNYFQDFKDFRELVILSKYLDVLRKIDNEIYYERKLFSDSLSVKIKNLNVLIKDKNIENQDIGYFKNQLYYGKVSDAQNYIIKKISKIVDRDVSINLNIFQKMIVELYCYNILIQPDRSCSLCINILRNISYNPNLFFKNIAMKTRFKTLRNFLLAHLKYSNFSLHSINKYIKIIKYIDKHYSNPSFIVEYHVKSTKIIRSKEFRKIEFDKLVNKNYKINFYNGGINNNITTNNHSSNMFNNNSLYNYNSNYNTQNMLTSGGLNNNLPIGINNNPGSSGSYNNANLIGSSIINTNYNSNQISGNPSNNSNQYNANMISGHNSHGNKGEVGITQNNNFEKNANNMIINERSTSNKFGANKKSSSKNRETFFEICINKNSLFLDVENGPLISDKNLKKIKELFISNNMNLFDNSLSLQFQGTNSSSIANLGNINNPISSTGTSNILIVNNNLNINTNIGNLNGNISTLSNNININTSCNNNNNSNNLNREVINNNSNTNNVISNSSNNLNLNNNIHSSNSNYSNLSFKIFEKNILELFSNYFMNNEIDDFGMKMKDFLKKPHYMTSDYYHLISNLILNYFIDHDEKIYLLNTSDDGRFIDCLICKKYQSNSSKESVNTNTETIGYSNLTIENLKYFDVSNIVRIKFDDFIQKFSQSKDLLKVLTFNDFLQIKSLFYYITGHYQTNFLYAFMERLIGTKFFKQNFFEEDFIKSDYFSKSNDNFKFLFIKNELKDIFNFKDNSYIKETIFKSFINHGILIENYEVVSVKAIRDLIFNNLLKIDDKSYYRYFNIKEKSNINIIEKFISKRKYKANANNCLERLSKIDEKMDELILFSDNNHYLLQNLLDFDFLNPKYIFYKFQDKLNAWQRVILLSKYNCTNNIFEISLENISLLKKFLDNPTKERDLVLIFFGCLIYLKLQNIDFRHYCKILPKKIFQISESHMPLIIKEMNKSLLDFEKKNKRGLNLKNKSSGIFNDEINAPKHGNESINILKEHEKNFENFNFNLISVLGDKLKNDVYTCNNDISIKSLVNKYYKFLNNNHLSEWVNRQNNFSINLDNFEILIENGRVIDAFYYYQENFEGKLSKEDIYSIVYNICLNNLLNYNIFSAASTFLLLINQENDNDNKNIIVQIEAANRIINYEINQLVNTNNDMDINLSLSKVKLKNYENSKDQANQFFEIDHLTNYEDNKNSANLKHIINVYKKLVSEFREFNQPNNPSNQNNIFPILKKLEDATWESNQDFLLSTPKEINLESPWLLVSLFCKVHNYEMSLTLLHELGRLNSWILFLYKAQDQECPPTTVLQILEGYFSDQTLKKHLKITIQESILTQMEENSKNNLDGNINNRQDDDVLSLSSKPFSNAFVNNNSNKIIGNNSHNLSINNNNNFTNENSNGIIGNNNNFTNSNNSNIRNTNINSTGINNNVNSANNHINNSNNNNYIIEKAEKLDKYSFNKFFNIEEKERIIFNKVDFSSLKTNFNDFIIYNIKQKLTKTTSIVTQIYDPIYFMSITENPKERGLKNINILNEAININWKDLILVSMIFTNFDQETIFTCFTLYLYMSIKEILITKNSLEDFLKNIFIYDSNFNRIALGKNHNLIKNLREIFDNKKKNFKLSDLEHLIKILLLNNNSQVLLEVLELFEMQYSFEEFVLFNKAFFQNDFEKAFVHLFIFKNSMFEYFSERLSNNFIAKIIEEEGNINNINIEFITSEIKNFENLILVFFYQVSNTIINNLIELFDSDCFKLFKLLEILYLTKWNKRYSNYFKNMCVLDHIKAKAKWNLDYKSSFEMIVELLISENNFDVLSEYILSYEENKEDDTLLYNIFSTIASFEKNYILYNDEERSQFWNCMEELLINANFSKLQLARFFFYIIETKEEKFFIREQFILIIKSYQYFIQHFNSLADESETTNNANSKENNCFSSFEKDDNNTNKQSVYIGINNNMNIKKVRESDRLSKFMRSVIGYEIDKNKNLTENDIIDDLKNKIFMIVFSNCEFEKLKYLFKNNNNFSLDYILSIKDLIEEELREESPAINFKSISNIFWKKIPGTNLKNNFNIIDNKMQHQNLIKDNQNKISKVNTEVSDSTIDSEHNLVSINSGEIMNININLNNINNNSVNGVTSLNKNPYVHINSLTNNHQRHLNFNNITNLNNSLRLNNNNIYSKNINNINNTYHQSYLSNESQIANFNSGSNNSNNNCQNNLPSTSTGMFNNQSASLSTTNTLNYYNNNILQVNSTIVLIPFKDFFKKSCLNLINLNQLQICLTLSKFYNLSNDELEKFDNFMKFVINSFDQLKKIPYNDLNNILNKAFNKSLETVTHFIKTLQQDIKEILICNLNNCLNVKSLENIMLLTILKILISVGINLDINEFLNFDEKIETILYKLINSSLDSKNIFHHLNKLIDNDELLAKTIIEKFIFYRNCENANENPITDSQQQSHKFKLFRYVKYFKFPYKFGAVIKNNLNEAIQNMKNYKDFNGLFLELLFLGYYSYLKDCFHYELGEFNFIIKYCIDQNDFFYSMSNLFNICEDDVRVKEIFYCINHIIFKSDLQKIFPKSKDNKNMEICQDAINNNGCSFSSGIHIYNSSNNFGTDTLNIANNSNTSAYSNGQNNYDYIYGFNNNFADKFLNFQINENRDKEKKAIFARNFNDNVTNNCNHIRFVNSYKFKYKDYNNNLSGRFNIYGRFKSEIEFYDRIKNFKKLGNIYMKLAHEYSKSVEEKTLIEQKLGKTKGHNFDIVKKEQELTILNLYLRAAQQFLLDNCILNYSEVFVEINNLIRHKFDDDIDINLE